MPKYKKGDIIMGGMAKVTSVTKVPQKDRMSASNPFGLFYPYRYHYTYIKGPMKGSKGSAGCN